MSSLTLEQPAWCEHGVALGIAVALHVGVVYLLLNLSHTPELPPVAAAVIQTQLVSLPALVPVVPPEPAEPPPPAQEQVAEPAPAVQAPPVEDAALARKRVQQQVQRERQQQLDQARRQRQEAERQAQQAKEEQARQARLHEQQLAEARQAESARQAAARAATQARADAEAASRQYQPIAKQAPDYPQRALDRHIEGECTVAYTVDPQGRVSDPQVVGNCHPLFVKPSLAAAKRFRYQPKVVNGQAVAVANVKNTFSFRIE